MTISRMILSLTQYLIMMWILMIFIHNQNEICRISKMCRVIKLFVSTRCLILNPTLLHYRCPLTCLSNYSVPSVNVLFTRRITIKTFHTMQNNMRVIMTVILFLTCPTPQKLLTMIFLSKPKIYSHTSTWFNKCCNRTL